MCTETNHVQREASRLPGDTTLGRLFVEGAYEAEMATCIA
jgi:hypothetical protein